MLSLGLVAVGQPEGWGPFPWAASSPRAGGDGGAVDSGCPRSPGCGFRVSQISRTPRYPPWELESSLVNSLRLPTPLEQGVAEVPLGSGCPGAQEHLPRSSLSRLPSLIPGAGSGAEQGWLAAGAWGEAPSPSLGAGGGDAEGAGCPRGAQPQTRAPCQHPLPRDRLPGRARLPLLPLVPVPLP